MIAKHLPILMYHQVLPETSEHFKKHIAVDPKVLREHIQTLLDDGWKIETVKEYFSKKAAGKADKKVAILTFDDVASSFMEYGLPVLEEFGVKASLFPIQNMTFSKEYHNLSKDGVRGLSEDELKKLHELGHELGSHGQSHQNLHKIPFEQVKQELAGSKKWLEALTGEQIHTVCYPIGGIDKDIVELSKELGYKNGLTTFKCSLQMPGDVYTLRRVDIKNHIQGDKFKSAIGPFYGFRRFLTRPFRSKYRVDFRHPDFN